MIETMRIRRLLQALTFCIALFLPGSLAVAADREQDPADVQRTGTIYLPPEIDRGMRMLTNSLAPAGAATSEVAGISARLREAAQLHKTDPDAMPRSRLFAIIAEEGPRISSACRDIEKGEPEMQGGTRCLLGGARKASENFKVVVTSIHNKCERLVVRATELKEERLPVLAQELQDMDEADPEYRKKTRELARLENQYKRDCWLAKYYSGVLATFREIAKGFDSYGGLVDEIIECLDEMYLTVAGSKELILDILALEGEAGIVFSGFEQLIGEGGRLAETMQRTRDVKKSLAGVKEALDAISTSLRDNNAIVSGLAKLRADGGVEGEIAAVGGRKGIKDRIDFWANQGRRVQSDK